MSKLNEEIKKLLLDYYGLTLINYKVLNGYDDKNFHVTVDVKVNDNNKHISEVNRCGYVLKIVNSDDSKNESIFDAQTALLLHLEKNNILCPSPVQTIDGKPHAKILLSSGIHIVRLLKYIEGTTLYDLKPNSEIYFQIGQLTANIDTILQSFRHAAYDDHTNPWTLGEVPNLKNYIHATTDNDKKKLFQQIISEFKRRVSVRTDGLEKGLIHGDVNEQNVLLDKDGDRWNVKALIDYGDVHYAYYLFEVAIAMAYIIFHSGNIDSGAYVLAGYKSVRDVAEQEFNLLKICVSARLVQSLVMGAYANLKDPENKYILTTATIGWEVLKKMSEIPEDHLLQRWKHISDTYIYSDG